MLRIGSLFSGAAALDMAVERVFGGRTVWHCELDPAASKVLAHRFPGVPNLGDITKVDWSRVEPVDVLCGGFPCQDVSAAGKQAGMGVGTRSGLWSEFARAINELRPPLVVIENVRNLLSVRANRGVESYPNFVGDNDSELVLRALGAVLGDLSDLRYDAQWTTISAASVGAPHRRERIFIIATNTRSNRWGWRPNESGRPTWRAADLAADSSCDGWDEGRPESAGIVGGSDAPLSGDGPLLPTPAVNDIGDGKTVEWWDEWCAKAKAKHGNGNGHGNSLAIEAQRMSGDGRPVELLPTPRTSDTNGAGVHGDGGMDLRTTVTLLATPSASDGAGGKTSRSGDRIGEPLLGGQAREMATAWGKYEPAIRRWEHLTRPAPAPTEPNKNGNPRLSAAFSEWLMGWPDGWVTQVPGISRNDMLRIVGNGVCPQQCEAALRYLLSVSEVAA